MPLSLQTESNLVHTDRMVCARGMSFMSSCLFVVCLFVHHFLPCSHVQGTFKSSLYSTQVDQVKKVACRWSTIDRYGLEAKKTLVLTRG